MRLLPDREVGGFRPTTIATRRKKLDSARGEIKAILEAAKKPRYMDSDAVGLTIVHMQDNIAALPRRTQAQILEELAQASHTLLTSMDGSDFDHRVPHRDTLVPSLVSAEHLTYRAEELRRPLWKRILDLFSSGSVGNGYGTGASHLG